MEIGSTTDAVGFIDYVQQVKRKVKGWESNTGEYREGQQVLERHRFQFPSNWLYTDNVDGEWSAFNEILKRKDATILAQVSIFAISPE